MRELKDSIRRELIVLARRSNSRTSQFSSSRPTDWRPSQVRNPDGILDRYFTDPAAWELIATQLEAGHPVEIVELKKPPGAKGYVMKIDIEPDQYQLYVKVQLGSGKIIGRSFHYSD